MILKDGVVCHAPVLQSDADARQGSTLRKRLSAGVQVMQMFDKAEAEYRELSEKKRIVENDKDKIRKVHMRGVMWLSLRCHMVKPCAGGTEV